MNVITIIVPIYNVESFLDDCLMSIVNQTYDNIEVILVEDKSPDGSLSIARKYKEQYGFKLIEKEVNQGLSEARNSALDIMTGDFVLFLDSDDALHPRTCEFLISVYCNDKPSIISFRNFRFESEVNFNDIDVTQCTPVNVTPLEELSNGIMACARLYKSELFDGLRFPVGMVSEDTATVPRLLCRAEGLSTINITFYAYRRALANSITSNGELLMKDSPNAIRLLLDSKEVPKEIIQYLTLKMFITLTRRFIISKFLWKVELDSYLTKNEDLLILLRDIHDIPVQLTKKDRKYAISLISYIKGHQIKSLFPFIVSWSGKMIKSMLKF